MNEILQNSHESTHEHTDFDTTCEAIDQLARNNAGLIADFEYTYERRNWFSYTKTKDEGPEMPLENYSHPPLEGVIDIGSYGDVDTIDLILEHAEKRLNQLAEQEPDLKNTLQYKAIFQGPKLELGNVSERMQSVTDAGSKYETLLTIRNGGAHQEYLLIRGAIQQSLRGFLVTEERYQLTTPALLSLQCLKDNLAGEQEMDATGQYL